MPKKRKDNRGRLLKKGEYQRPNLTYEYRYTDALGKRHSIYAPTLEALREQEDKLQTKCPYPLPPSSPASLAYAEGNFTVLDLLERYISLKQGVRYATTVGYGFVMNLVKKEEFGYRKINTIRTSDAKLWFMKLQKDGRGYSTITSVRGVIKPAFQMAYEEDIIRKNPFDFKLNDVVRNDSKKREALTPEQAETFMNFIRNDSYYCRYYDEFLILLETGMRVSELCGLTKDDLDFENRKIKVDHQLVRERGGKYYVEKTKTESGRRFIPMTDSVFESLKNVLKRRAHPKREWIIDGYKGFLFLDKDDKPYVALHVEHHMQWATQKYRRLYPNDPLPKITPHVLRHTFCTNMANAGMDLKSLQYLMGHSDASVTMNVYTHASYAHAEESMRKVLQFQPQDAVQKSG